MVLFCSDGQVQETSAQNGQISFVQDHLHENGDNEEREKHKKHQHQVLSRSQGLIKSNPNPGDESLQQEILHELYLDQAIYACNLNLVESAVYYWMWLF